MVICSPIVTGTLINVKAASSETSDNFDRDLDRECSRVTGESSRPFTHDRLQGNSNVSLGLLLSQSIRTHLRFNDMSQYSFTGECTTLQCNNA